MVSDGVTVPKTVRNRLNQSGVTVPKTVRGRQEGKSPLALAQTYRRRLLERAQDQYGYVTARDAEGLGVPAVELRKLAQRGGLRHVVRGVYRFDEVPATGHDQLMEAVLAVGPGAHLTRDAVLLLHDLGL